MKKGVMIAGSFVVLSAFLCVAAIMSPTDEIEKEREESEMVSVRTAVATATQFVRTAVAAVIQATATPDRCESASDQMIEAIRSGIKDVAEYNDLVANSAVAVKSGSFESVWFVAAEITGESIGEGIVGVWAISGDRASPGMVLSVNEYAKVFSSYPDGSGTAAGISMDDDGAKASEGCVK